MAVIAVGSVRGAPGATLLALDLARFCPGEVLLIEADPDGGCLAARLGLAVRPGLTELAGAARVGIASTDLWRFAQPTDHGVAVIVGHPAAEPVQAALRAAVHHVGSSLGALGRHVVIDVGRLRPGSPALGFAALADRLLIASENSAEAVVAITHRARLLQGLAEHSVVLTTATPYSAAEIATTTGSDVWGVVPGAGRRRRGIRRRSRALTALIETLIPPSLPTALGSDMSSVPGTEAVDAVEPLVVLS